MFPKVVVISENHLAISASALFGENILELGQLEEGEEDGGGEEEHPEHSQPVVLVLECSTLVGPDPFSYSAFIDGISLCHNNTHQGKE